MTNASDPDRVNFTPSTTEPRPMPKPNGPTYDYPLHPLAKMFPPLPHEDLEKLAEDIKANGILEKLTLHQGQIIDGQNRKLAADMAAYRFTERDFQDLPPGIDPLAYVISKNLKRRQLTAEQRHALIDKVIEARPRDSNRAIAKLVGCDDKTVAKLRENVAERFALFLDTWRKLKPAQRAARELWRRAAAHARRVHRSGARSAAANPSRGGATPMTSFPQACSLAPAGFLFLTAVAVARLGEDLLRRTEDRP